MKQFIGYIISWGLYYIGDFISKIINLSNFFGGLYPLYNKVMCMSFSVQDWSGNKTPWEKVEEDWV
jgi:hypothetical protein